MCSTVDQAKIIEWGASRGGVGPQPSKRLTVLLDSCDSRPAREVAERERDSAVKEAREK